MTRSSLLFLAAAAIASAQTPAAETPLDPPPPSIAGDWKGALVVGPNSLHLVVQIIRSSDGLLFGRMDSIDQGSRIPLDTLQLPGGKVRLEAKSVNGTFDGTLSADGNSLKGTWSQGVPLPLELTRIPASEAASLSARLAPPPGALAAVIKSIGVPLDVQIPTTPIAVRGPAGGQNLIYEIHFTNTASVDLHLSRIEILNGDASLVSYEGAELNGILQSFGPDVMDKRTLPGGVRTVAYVLGRLAPNAAIPATLRNRITVEGVALDIPVSVSSAQPIVLGPPLRGSNWLAGNGPSNTSIHRRGLVTIGNRLHIPERFAIDWVKVDDQGRTFSGGTAGAATDNKTHYAYGSEILAVADATVVEMKDGIPENVPGPTSRAVPITLETIGGNHVVLDLGGSRFAFYAHLQPGTLRVKIGDKVKRGQVLGLVGNTGNSTEPHLHFQVTDGSVPLGSEGIPYVIDSFEVLGPTATGPKTNALPLDRTRVRFAEK